MSDLVADLRKRGFYLGGSRRMAEKYPDLVKVGEATDWDLSAPFNTYYETMLTELGFKLMEYTGDGNYRDNLACAFYQKDNIQVVLRSDTGTYTAVFEAIDPQHYINKLWKSSPVVGQFDRQACMVYFNTEFQKVRTSAKPTDLPF